MSTPTLITPDEAFDMILQDILDDTGEKSLERRLITLAALFGFRDVIHTEDKTRCGTVGIKGIIEIPPMATTQGKFLAVLLMIIIELKNPESKPGTIPGDAVIKLAESFDYLLGHVRFNLAEVLTYIHVRNTLLRRG